WPAGLPTHQGKSQKSECCHQDRANNMGQNSDQGHAPLAFLKRGEHLQREGRESRQGATQTCHRKQAPFRRKHTALAEKSHQQANQPATTKVGNQCAPGNGVITGVKPEPKTPAQVGANDGANADCKNRPPHATRPPQAGLWSIRVSRLRANSSNGKSSTVSISSTTSSYWRMKSASSLLNTPASRAASKRSSGCSAV